MPRFSTAAKQQQTRPGQHLLLVMPPPPPPHPHTQLTWPPLVMSVKASLTSGAVQNWGATSSSRRSSACEEDQEGVRGEGGKQRVHA
jgi:hypothetical protein